MSQIQSEVERRKVKAALLEYGMEIAKIPSMTLDVQVIEWATDAIDSVIEMLRDKTGSDNSHPRTAFMIRYDKAKYPEKTNEEIAKFFNVPESMVREILKDE